MAFLFGVAQVILALKNKTLNFYAGVVSVVLYIYVFYQFGLFAESLLNLYYLIMSIAGIFLWNKKETLPVAWTKKKEWIIPIFIGFISWCALYFVLKSYTTSTVPFLDSFVTATAWTGTWLLVKRKIENWLVLNISNLVAIPLQYYKGLELTSLLTTICFVVAILGFIEWRKQVLIQPADES